MHPDFQGVAGIREVDGRPAFSVGPQGFVTLGRWSTRAEAMTIAFWAYLEGDPQLNRPEFDLVLFEAWEPNLRLQFVVREGHLGTRRSTGPVDDFPRFGGLHFASERVRIPVGRWTHFAISADRVSVRFWVDGREAGTLSLADLNVVQNARMALGPGSVEGLTVHYDDVVLFGRTLLEPEVRSLAAAHRGDLAGTYGRSKWHGRLREWALAGSGGGLVVLALFIGFFVLSQTIGWDWSSFREPEARFSAGFFAAQLTLVLAAAFWFGREARRLDRLDFERETDQFVAQLESDLRRLGDLTNLARDWALAGPNLTNLNQPDWERWVSDHRVEFDFPGFLGIGLAQPVLPEWENAMTGIWSKRHGFPFGVWHDSTWGTIARPRRIIEELRAPVVVYHAWHLPTQLWLSNQTILGKDLLAMPERVAAHEIMPEPDRIAEAIGNGNLTSSGIIELAPESWYGRPIRGIRLYSAAVKHPTEPPERITASLLDGPIGFTSVDLGRWIQETLQRTPPRLACQLWAGETHEDRHQFGFDSGALLPEAQFRPDARFRVTREVKAFYFRLWIDFASTAGFEAGARENWQWHLCGVGLAFSALTSGMVLLQGRRRATLRRQSARLVQANSELMKAQKERERLSRNLHDGTIQNLYAVGLHLQYARRLIRSDESPALLSVGEAQLLVQDTIVELREFLLALKDEAIRGRPFRIVFGEVLERLRTTTKIELALNVSTESDQISSSLVVQLVQIAREALSNALRHSQAGRIEIALLPSPVQGDPKDGVTWQLRIEDNGVGFAKDAGARQGGLGLMSMRERASELGSCLSIDSVPGTGTCIHLDFLVEPDGISSDQEVDSQRLKR